MKLLKALWPFFSGRDRNVVLYEDFKRERPDDIPNLKQFGVKSIIMSVLSLVLGVLCVLGIALCISSANMFFMIFGTIFLVYIAIVGCLVVNIKSIILWSLQLKCNKKAIGWVALAIWIVSTLLTLVVPLVLIAIGKK